jgi:hypothetical protein
MQDRLLSRFAGLWSGGHVTMRFFADDGAEKGGAVSGPQADASAAAPSDQAPAAFPSIYDSSGKLVDGWQSHFKEEIGDSKYFDTAFKPGRDSIKDLVRHIRELSWAKGRALIPKPDAPDEEWVKVWEAAGKPASPKDYGLTLDDEDKMDPGFVKLVKDVGFLDKLAEKYHKCGVPLKLAGQMANAELSMAMDRYAKHQEAISKAKESVQAGLGKTSWDDAEKNGREALARLYGHSSEKESPEFNELMGMLKDEGLADHPYIVGLLHKLAMRMNPGKILVGGTTPVTVRNTQTGPGVQDQPDFVSAMRPNTLAQVRHG